MNTEIEFCGIKMKNPVTVASGTFGYGRGHNDFIDLNRLGAIITKGTSLKPKTGNKPPRICETASRNDELYRSRKSWFRLFYKL